MSLDFFFIILCPFWLKTFKVSRWFNKVFVQRLMCRAIFDDDPVYYLMFNVRICKMYFLDWFVKMWTIWQVRMTGGDLMGWLLHMEAWHVFLWSLGWAALWIFCFACIRFFCLGGCCWLLHYLVLFDPFFCALWHAGREHHKSTFCRHVPPLLSVGNRKNGVLFSG